MVHRAANNETTVQDGCYAVLSTVIMGQHVAQSSIPAADLLRYVTLIYDHDSWHIFNTIAVSKLFRGSEAAR